MIIVTYNPDKFVVTVKGHAEYDKKGKDIVCSAASMVFYNLVAVLSKCPGSWFEELPKVTESEPATITCKPTQAAESNVLFAFQYCATGFETLARNHPDNVKFKMITKR